MNALYPKWSPAFPESFKSDINYELQTQSVPANGTCVLLTDSFKCFECGKYFRDDAGLTCNCLWQKHSAHSLQYKL